MDFFFSTAQAQGNTVTRTVEAVGDGAVDIASGTVNAVGNVAGEAVDMAGDVAGGTLNVATEGVNVFTGVLMDAFGGFTTQIAETAPTILYAFLTLLAGWLAAVVLSWAIKKILRFVKLDHYVERYMPRDMLKIDFSVTKLIGKIVYYLVFLGALMGSMDMIGLTMVSDAIKQIMGFLPNVLSAAVILLVGLFIANLVGKFIVNAAESTGSSYGGMAAKAAKTVIGIFVSLIAFRQLNIDTSIIDNNIETIFMALAGIAVVGIGWGARNMFGNAVAGAYVKDLVATGDKVTINGVTGTVKSVTNMAVVLDTADGKVIVPTNQFMS